MKQFGAKITSSLRERYAQSPNWKENKFQNLEETKMGIHFHDIPKLLYKQFCESAGREPTQPLPVRELDTSAFLENSSSPSFVWYGHSVLLMRIDGLNILIDPMFGSDASPIAPFTTQRFSPGTLDIIDALPEIDLVLISHDHYDHLDLVSIQRLAPKVKLIYTALGVGRHLEYWKIEKEKIREFDWWHAESFHDLIITFTPSRHFSGRGIRDRFRSLWGGWAFQSQHHTIYFSGDGGYGDHFKVVGERLGPFTIGFMESGQYNKLWHQIHMFPEEAVQAALDAGVNTAVPVHWGAFSLAQHSWKDPVIRFVQAAGEQGLTSLCPYPGEVFSPASVFPPWWENFD